MNDNTSTELNLDFDPIVFPEEPTTTHLRQALDWILDHCDPYVAFLNSGPFVYATHVKFVISNEGDTVQTPVSPLNLPLFVLHENMPDVLKDGFREYYGIGEEDVEEPTVN